MTRKIHFKNFIISILTLSILFVSGCVQQQEIKLDARCDAEGINAICTSACMGNYTAELDAWRCSATGQPVCICKAYKESGQFIG